MPGSFTDMLPPEAQSLLGGIALLVAIVGLIVWAAGVKIARFSVAMLLGAAIAALGAWLLPRIIGIAPITGGLVGFVAGALIGALGFRLLQGLTVAVCLGVAVGGMYYRWNVLPALADVRPAATVSAPITSELIPLDALPPGTAASQTATNIRPETWSLNSLGESLSRRWSAIPAIHRKRILIAGVGTAAIALLVAFGFARQTTWFATALLGSLMLIAGLNALLHIYAQQYETRIIALPSSRYGALAIMTVLGMLVQRRFFWPVHGVRKRTVAPAAVPLNPTP